jgi:hypothetical protein
MMSMETCLRPTCFFLGFSAILHAVPGVASLIVAISAIMQYGFDAKDKTKVEIFLLVEAALAAAFLCKLVHQLLSGIVLLEVLTHGCNVSAFVADFAIKVQRVFSEPYVGGNSDLAEACCCHPDVYKR